MATEYKSPQYEELVFSLMRDKLISVGYPEELKEYNYDPTFPIRGLWFDRMYGTLLKMDQFGNILRCIRGFNILSGQELRALYPNKFLKFDEKRIDIMNTLFTLPEIYVVSCVIHILMNKKDCLKLENGISIGNLYMSYTSIYEDVRTVCDWMHMGELKRRTLADISRYVEKDERVGALLDRLRSNDAKVFLLTNSDFHYTKAIMSYILEDPDAPDHEKRSWISYFDYIVTDARKPDFFQEGTILRSIELSTGKRSIGHHTGPLVAGQIYSGGSCEVFSNLIGARGKDVLYVGDHVYGDILKSKKTVGWRTYLVIPELINEIFVWKDKKVLFDKLQELDGKLESSYRDLTITSNIKPEVEEMQVDIRDNSVGPSYAKVAKEMDEAYGVLGSLFRSGSRQTFFSAQVLRYADIYSFSCINLMYYPLFYTFRVPAMLMPHESTVSHDDSPKDSLVDGIDTDLQDIQSRIKSGETIGNRAVSDQQKPCNCMNVSVDPTLGGSWFNMIFRLPAYMYT